MLICRAWRGCSHLPVWDVRGGWEDIRITDVIVDGILGVNGVIDGEMGRREF